MTLQSPTTPALAMTVMLARLILRLGCALGQERSPVLFLITASFSNFFYKDVWQHKRRDLFYTLVERLRNDSPFDIIQRFEFRESIEDVVNLLLCVV